jgi:hypothetical protein
MQRLTVAAICALTACSGSSSNETDLLRGVAESSAGALCKSFFENSQALNDARVVLELDGMETAADGYERLAVDARAFGARRFASAASEVADATRALVQSARPAQQAGKTGTASDAAVSAASLMTTVLKVQLPETRLALACYSRDHAPFDS